MTAPPPPPTDPPPQSGESGVPKDALEFLARLEAELPEAEKSAIRQVPRSVLIAMSVEARRFSGPVPPPEMIREYDEILPGAANRIFTMAENQQNHRIAIEKIAIPAGERRANRGQFCALTVSLVGLGVAAYAIREGMQWAAIGIGGADLAVLAGLFLVGRWNIVQSLRRKQQP